MKTVDVMALDGFEFEILCQHILQDYFKVTVIRTPPVNDMGKDLIIKFPAGDVYVECKHFSEGSVGRPIVQKLQGAMFTDKIEWGMIITTSHFSSDAIRYVTENKLKIKLVDNQKLTDIATKAGYILSGDLKTLPLSNVKYISDMDFKKLLSKNLSSRIKSYPQDINNVLKLVSRQTRMLSFYRVLYDINSSFSTTVGIIHSEVGSGSVLIRESTGKIEEIDYLKNVSQSEYEIFNPMKCKCDVETPKSMLLQQITEKAVNHIIRKHTAVVHYTGKNNGSYSKECVPSKRDIYIRQIVHVYIPCSVISINLFGKSYISGIVENNSSNFTDDGNLCHTCGISNRICDWLYLCNDCGMLVSNNFSYICSMCGKTMCCKCASYFRKYIFFKKPICESCSRQNLNLKVKKYNF